MSTPSRKNLKSLFDEVATPESNSRKKTQRKRKLETPENTPSATKAKVVSKKRGRESSPSPDLNKKSRKNIEATPGLSSPFKRLKISSSKKTKKDGKKRKSKKKSKKDGRLKKSKRKSRKSRKRI